MNITEFKDAVVNYATQHGEEIIDVSTITNDDYSIIEYVYTWYPTIDNVKGKEQVAMLLCEFGIRIFHNMYSTAKKAEQLDAEMRKAKTQWVQASKKWYDFVEGNDI